MEFKYAKNKIYGLSEVDALEETEIELIANGQVKEIVKCTGSTKIAISPHNKKIVIMKSANKAATLNDEWQTKFIKKLGYTSESKFWKDNQEVFSGYLIYWTDYKY